MMDTVQITHLRIHGMHGCDLAQHEETIESIVVENDVIQQITTDVRTYTRQARAGFGINGDEGGADDTVLITAGHWECWWVTDPATVCVA